MWNVRTQCNETKQKQILTFWQENSGYQTERSWRWEAEVVE